MMRMGHLHGLKVNPHVIVTKGIYGGQWRNLTTHFHQITMTTSSNRTCGPHLPRAWRARHCLCSVLGKYASAQSHHEETSDKRKLRQSAKYQLVFFIHMKAVKDTDRDWATVPDEGDQGGRTAKCDAGSALGPWPKTGPGRDSGWNVNKVCGWLNSAVSALTSGVEKCAIGCVRCSH